jgi:dihydrofolate reductase
MGKIVAVTHLTLDGVMQAPARADEDQREGFPHGGWSMPYGDAVMASSVGPGMSSATSDDGGLLLGRRTYEDFSRVWPQRKDNPFTERLNSASKYVASTTLAEPLPWANSILLSGDVPAEVRALKQRLPGDLVVLGSGALLQSLMRHDLVDEFLLTIHPLVLGRGRRLFPSDGPRLALHLVESKPTTTGVIIARYAAAHAPERDGAEASPSPPSRS